MDMVEESKKRIKEGKFLARRSKGYIPKRRHPIQRNTKEALSAIGIRNRIFQNNREEKKKGLIAGGIKRIAEAVSYRVPIVVSRVRYYGDNDAYPICPRCKLTIDREYMAYCDRCGQRLDWSMIEYARVCYGGAREKDT
jgi:hypothetical protein